jgi:hypothetical protein
VLAGGVVLEEMELGVGTRAGVDDTAGGPTDVWGSLKEAGGSD